MLHIMSAVRFLFILALGLAWAAAAAADLALPHHMLRRPAHLHRATAVHPNVAAPHHAGRQGNSRSHTAAPQVHGSRARTHALGRSLPHPAPLASPGRHQHKRSGKPYRGVNLGGWMVLETWMSPSVVAQLGDSRVVDEWTLGQYVPHAKAEPVLQAHWDNWVQEADFVQMSQAGLNFVRIPVGYWIWDKDSANEPYVISNQTAYIERAVDWCKKYGLQVMIDLHGVPGSQNGFDTSGHTKDSYNFHDSPQNAVRAVRVLRHIASHFSQPKYKGTVTMIEVINEPLCDRSDRLLNYVVEYYHKAYNAIRSVAGNDLTVVLADGFVPLSQWNQLLANTSWTNVMIDTHAYLQYYNANLGREAGTPYTQQGVESELCTYRNLLNKSKYPVLVGEFSMSMPACPNCWSNPVPTYNFLQSAFQTQASVFETAAAGWSLWAWRIEGDSPGSYESGMQSGWIPKQLGNYKLAKC